MNALGLGAIAVSGRASLLKVEMEGGALFRDSAAYLSGDLSEWKSQPKPRPINKATMLAARTVRPRHQEESGSLSEENCARDGAGSEVSTAAFVGVASGLRCWTGTSTDGVGDASAAGAAGASGAFGRM